MRLDVWMEAVEAPVGTLERHADKSLEFAYAQGVPTEGRLSAALPIRDAHFGDAACIAFFGNLLFEGRELDRVMAAHRIDRDDIGGLLFHLGADCPGAVSITPAGSGPGKRPGVFPDDYEEVPAARLAEFVRSLHFHGRLPDGARDPSPIAGVQPKIAVLHHDKRFFLPREGSRAPTTHILKISPRDDLDLARHEAALLSLAGRLGIESAECAYLEFHDQETSADIGTILSRRFDRIFDGATVRRVHSEDLCQALGLARHLKYERDAVSPDIRFSMRAVGDLARRTARPALFQIGFLRQTLFNLAVGNTDNHAKNTTILYRQPAGKLAPLYDVIPATMDARVTHELALTLGGACFAEDLSIVHLERAMRDLGFAKARFSGQWSKLLKEVAQAGVPFLAEAGGKSLADAVAAQLFTLDDALGINLEVPRRDYFPRNVRDEKAARGGWTTFN